eukprot:274703-Prorocentrum_minimum.AAC.1
MKRTRGQGALRQAYLPSPRHNFPTQVAPFRASGFPVPFRSPHTFREFSGATCGFCSSCASCCSSSGLTAELSSPRSEVAPCRSRKSAFRRVK